MKAILCESYGPPEALRIAILPDPVPGPGEVAVAVSYVGLNFFDTLIIRKKYQIEPPLPFSPGAEFSGVVCQCGSRVAAFKPGDRVAGFIGYGACREQVICRADQLILLPATLAETAAAGLGVTYGTSLYALHQRANLQQGETLAVFGAAGGAGMAAVEIGRLMGAHVIACASSAEKLALAKMSGAHDAIDYTASDVKSALRTLTQGRGVDVIYDPVGGSLSEAALRAIAWQGRYLVIGFASGEIPRIPLNLTLLKGCDVRGVFWGEFVRRDPATHQRNLAQLANWAVTGTIRPHIHAVYEPDHIADALNELGNRTAQGKILVQFRSPHR
jgi:NADPH2:quinone reductase